MRAATVLRTVVQLTALVVLFALGIWLGGHPRYLPDPIRDSLVGDDAAQTYAEAVDLIEGEYYRPVGDRQLSNASLAALVRSLDDRFSHYFDPSSYREFQASTSGEFSGVGLSVSQHPLGLRVDAVFDGSPAKRAGLKVGDLILKANGRSLKGLSSDASTARIKGKPGTSVRLTVRSGKRTREVTVTRAVVAVPSVDSEMVKLPGGRTAAHVRLAGFTSGAHGEVGQAVKRLLAKGADGVILDLRGNGGGLLTEARLVASIFIPEGPIVTVDGRSQPRRTLRATGDAIPERIPVVVLVDRGSASASEIVTGALQDTSRAEVVGTRTFGKGVFQQVWELNNGGALELTVGQYFLPSGRNLGGRGVNAGSGIKPDVQAKDDPDTPRDEALSAAERELAGQK
jgi:carboxyl-terminal processing protease